MVTIKGEALAARAKRVFPGGTMLGYPLGPVGGAIARGQGAHVWDVDGNEYVDYVLGSGPLVIGHAHPRVVAAIVAQAPRGVQFSGAYLNEPAVALAEAIVAAAPVAEHVRFTTTGNEATFGALRLARAATGRPLVLKFEGGYHGSHDVSVASMSPPIGGHFPAPSTESAGLPPHALDQVVVAPYNDLATTEKIVADHARELAAILIEPQQRGIEPEPGFMEGLRALSRQHGALLIFDEIVTGFRLAYGGAQERYGVVPDLAIYGKAIGGGLPLAAITGSAELLGCLEGSRKGRADFVFLSGTHPGMPLAATAGLATLERLSEARTYEHLSRVGERLRAGVSAAAQRAGVKVAIVGGGSVFNVHFTGERIIDYAGVARANRAARAPFQAGLAKRGVLVNLDTKFYASTEHTDADVDRTLAAVEQTLGDLARSGTFD